jgi:hypothetical protein
MWKRYLSLLNTVVCLAVVCVQGTSLSAEKKKQQKTTTLMTAYIDSITLTNRILTKNGSTPEDQALKYLIEEDTTFDFDELLTLNDMMTNVVKFRIRQRYALLTLWFQQAFTNTTWTDRNGWLVNANECDDWFGIQCVSVDWGGNVGIQNSVQEIDLFRNNVHGTIPADLGLLAALTSFIVNENALTGTLPESVGQWTSLTFFDTFRNALTGTLPSSIGQLTLLNYWDVGVNALTGTLPESINNWSQIQRAFFDYNQFTGTVPVISACD